MSRQLNYRATNTHQRPLLAGNTPLITIPGLADYFAMRHLLIKDESENPLGTHKDRKSLYIVTNAQRLCGGIDPAALCIVTSGNAGFSLAAFASERRLPVIAIVDRSASQQVVRQLSIVCKRTLCIDLETKRWTSKQIRMLAGETKRYPILDATYSSRAYQCIANEVAYEAPEVILLPVGTGELFVGLAAGLRRLKMKTRLIGITAKTRNPLADKLYAYWTPLQWRLQQLTSPPSPHQIIELEDDRLLQETYQVVGGYLRCEPSSAAAFVLLRMCIFNPNTRIVILNTGTGRAQKTIAKTPRQDPAQRLRDSVCEGRQLT